MMKNIIGLVLVLSGSAFAETGTLGKVVGQVGLVEGQVTVDNKAVKKDAVLREGSIVETKKGKATLIIGKGSVFNLAADSKMVVNQYGASPSGENADLDLKFGKTRALILNQNDKKDIKIRARAATMGVRGTEIFVDVPKEPAKPLQFFTIEGKADVYANNASGPVSLGQNQGVSTSGAAVASSGGGDKKGGDDNKGDNKSAKGDNKGGDNKGDAKGGDNKGATASNGAPKPQSGGGGEVTALSASEIKAEIKKAGLDAPAGLPAGPPQTPPPGAARALAGNLSDQLGIGALPPIQLDPLLDRTATISIQPHFCNAVTGVCN